MNVQSDSSDSDSSDSDSDDSSDEEKPKKDNKRKAEEAPAATEKKAKTTEFNTEDDATKNLFVGSLSWNIDNDWLKSEFESFGEIVRADVITDRATGRSKG